MANTSAKAKIIDAFQRILSEKSFSKITVKDIADEAGISHMTFYRNFADKYELVGEICYEDMMLFSKIYGNNAEWKSIVYCILNTIKNNEKFYGKIFKDEEALAKSLEALVKVSVDFTGAQATRASYLVWEETFKDWAKRGFTGTIDEVYKRLIGAMPLNEIFTGEALDEAIRMYESNTLNDFRNRQKNK